jgi:hypothetical protein
VTASRLVDVGRRVAVLGAVAMAFAGAGCGDASDPSASSLGDQPASGACGPVETENLDPASGRHILPGAPEPVYRTDPPTSGAHQPGEVPGGVLDAPLSKPVQVGALEEGAVIVHWKGLSPTDVDALATLVAGRDQVVVMPDPAISDPVVVTAWLHRLRCSEPDLARIGDFVDQRMGRGAAHPG